MSEIGDYYNNLISRYGHNPKSCDYGRETTQKLKFEILSSFRDHSNQSILDIGCGFADYYSFLNDRFEDVKYYGVDLSELMIEKAKELHPELNLELKNVFDEKINEKYDIVTANGIFYLLGENAKETMFDYIRKMYEMANKAVIFNSLSSFTENKDQNEFYADPTEIFTFCSKLSNRLAIRHDYHPRDFSIYIQKV